MSISLTASAAERVRKFLDDEGGGAVRFGLRRTGCSGWAYVVEIIDAPQADDHCFEDAGITIVVDPKSLPRVDGTCIDFQQQGLNQAFTFDNPNVTGECGCGESVAFEAGPELSIRA